jgi:Glycosyl transferase family 2
MSVAAIIPASDLQVEEILQTVAAIPADWTRVIVANGAPRNSRDLILHLAREGKAEVDISDRVLGKTEAVRRGVSLALADESVEIVAQLDGDLKQVPTQVVRLVKHLVATRAECVIANRYESQELRTQPHRDALSSLMRSIVRAVGGPSVRDTVCGMRAYSRYAADLFAGSLRCFGYGLEIAQLLLVTEARLDVAEVGVSSALQAGATPAEKLEDNFCALVTHSPSLRPPEQLYELFCSCLVSLKARTSFVVDLPILRLQQPIRLDYVGSVMEVEDAYSAAFV